MLRALVNIHAGLIDTPLIESYLELGSSNYRLRAICHHPTTPNKLYATAKHALIEFDWSSNPDAATAKVKAGGPTAGTV